MRNSSGERAISVPATDILLYSVYNGFRVIMEGAPISQLNSYGMAEHFGAIVYGFQEQSILEQVYGFQMVPIWDIVYGFQRQSIWEQYFMAPKWEPQMVPIWEQYFMAPKGRAFGNKFMAPKWLPFGNNSLWLPKAGHLGTTVYGSQKVPICKQYFKVPKGRAFGNNS